MSDEQQEIDGVLAANRGWLRSVIAARLGTSDGADDVLQEVGVAVVEQKAPLQHQVSAKAWLFQIAVRQSLLFLRRVGRYRRHIGKAISRPEHSEDEDPLSWLLSTERQELIREALQRLNGRDREFLILKYVEGWSYREIATAQNTTERSVESRVHRARHKLREHLRQLDVIDDSVVEKDKT